MLIEERLMVYKDFQPGEIVEFIAKNVPGDHILNVWQIQWRERKEM